MYQLYWSICPDVVKRDSFYAFDVVTSTFCGLLDGLQVFSPASGKMQFTY